MGGTRVDGLDVSCGGFVLVQGRGRMYNSTMCRSVKRVLFDLARVGAVLGLENGHTQGTVLSVLLLKCRVCLVYLVAFMVITPSNIMIGLALLYDYNFTVF